MSEAGEALMARTAALIDVASVSRNEQELADVIERELTGIDGLDVVRIGDNVIARTTGDRRERILLGGHLDTVPPAGNERANFTDGALYGVGAADMKGGVAVMLDLVARAGSRPVESTYVFYAREEISRTESGLLEIEAARPDLLGGDAAIMLEPTDAIVEAGCQGSIRIEVRLGGVRAHSARPWTGLNAIHRLQGVLTVLAEFGDRRVMIEGCEFRESLQAVGVRGGGVGNVVPDEAVLLINYRFAPDKDIDGAVEVLRTLFAGAIDASHGDSITVVDAAPPAPPSLDHHVLRALVSASGAPPRAKLAWTDVAFFAERGVPAANFGPGDPLLAHRADEHVFADALEQVLVALDALLDQTAPDAVIDRSTAGAAP